MMEITKANIREYAKRYNERFRGTDDERVEKEMKEWLSKKKHLDRRGFIKIGLWKSKRPRRWYESKWNDDLSVKEITRFSFTAKSEFARVESLCVLKGVSYPLASVMLHFTFPKDYPILDFRVIWSLGWDQPKSYDFDFWQKYCKRIRNITREVGEDIRTVDKALWKFSEENQNL